MKISILMQVSALLILASCQPGSDFAKKNVQGSLINVSLPREENQRPIDPDAPAAGECSEITSYMLCVSSTGCEPVFRTDAPEIANGDEEALFSKCIPKSPAEDVVVDKPKTSELENPIVVTPPKEPEGEEPEGEEPYIDPKDPVKDPPVVVVNPPKDPVKDPPVVVNPPKDPIKDPPVVVVNPPKDPVKDPPVVVVNPPKDPVGEEPGEEPGGEKPGIPGSCDQIDPKHHSSGNGKGVKKVIICHNSSSKRHTIEIACPALKAHTSHHEDTVGACKEEN